MFFMIMIIVLNKEIFCCFVNISRSNDCNITGDNGILTRAAEAKEKTEEAQRKEESDLDYMDKVVNNESLVLY
mgnify:CR=1 FL=1